MQTQNNEIANVQNNLNELDEIERYVAEIIGLASQVDDTFKGIQKVYLDSMEEVLSEIPDKDTKGQTVAALAAVIGASAIQGVGGIISAVKIKGKASGLLEEKKKIADAKLPSIQGNIDRTDRMLQFMYNIFTRKFDLEYDVTEEKVDSIREEINTTLNNYRRVLYNCWFLNYLKNQFEAWKRGKQDGHGIIYPTMEKVNRSILLDDLFPVENNGENDINPRLNELVNNISRGDGYIMTGHLLYLLCDEELLATCFLYVEDPITLIENEYDIHQTIKLLLDENPSYDNLYSLYKIKIRNDAGMSGRMILYILNMILVVAILGYTLYISYEIGVVWKWVIGIVGALLVGQVTRRVVRNMGEKYNYKDELIDLYINNQLRLAAGYEPERLTMTDHESNANKTMAWGVLGGLFGFFFIPFPGGLILGALVGAAIGGSMTKEETNDVTGEEYKEVKLGHYWMAILILLASIGTLVYLIFLM